MASHGRIWHRHQQTSPAIARLPEFGEMLATIGHRLPQQQQSHLARKSATIRTAQAPARSPQRQQAGQIGFGPRQASPDATQAAQLASRQSRRCRRSNPPGRVFQPQSAKCHRRHKEPPYAEVCSSLGERAWAKISVPLGFPKHGSAGRNGPLVSPAGEETPPDGGRLPTFQPSFPFLKSTNEPTVYKGGSVQSLVVRQTRSALPSW